MPHRIHFSYFLILPFSFYPNQVKKSGQHNNNRRSWNCCLVGEGSLASREYLGESSSKVRQWSRGRAPCTCGSHPTLSLSQHVHNLPRFTHPFVLNFLWEKVKERRHFLPSSTSFHIIPFSLYIYVTT